MISRDEIEEKGREFGIHVANVQRDYVFGWLLAALYSSTALKDTLILKGGNCFRKAYFPHTRFSSDLDFSTEDAVDEGQILQEFNRACEVVQHGAGVVFDMERNAVRVQGQLDDRRRVFDVRVYFKDFYGNADHITIRLSIDITEFDKIFLPPQARRLIHPYSDASACAVELRCLKLEEMVANKVKCLLQRKHVPDVYDLVYAAFINRDILVDRSEVITTFLRKTIYQPSPGVARQLLLQLPLYALKAAWERYIIAPLQGALDFETTLGQFQSIINELFSLYPGSERASFAFFPPHLRMPIMEAGSDRRLIRLTYDGVSRIVEPYALAYKRRRDGHAEEYFYVYDRTGGRASSPGIKSLFNHKITDLTVLDEKFEPQFPIELAKAGELGSRDYFSGRGSHARAGFGSRLSTLRHGWCYTVQCPYCGRQFRRMRRNTRLKPHRGDQGYVCPAGIGHIVSQELV